MAARHHAGGPAAVNVSGFAGFGFAGPAARAGARRRASAVVGAANGPL